MIGSPSQSDLTATSSRFESEIDNHLRLLSMCPCCTISGPPNQPMDVRDSKQTYSHYSEELKKNKTYSRSLQTTWYKKYLYVAHVTKFFVMLVDQQSMKAFLCFQSAS